MQGKDAEREERRGAHQSGEVLASVTSTRWPARICRSSASCTRRNARAPGHVSEHRHDVENAETPTLHPPRSRSRTAPRPKRRVALPPGAQAQAQAPAPAPAPAQGLGLKARPTPRASAAARTRSFSGTRRGWVARRGAGPSICSRCRS